MRSLSDGPDLDKAEFVKSRQRKTQIKEKTVVVARGTTTEENKIKKLKENKYGCPARIR